MNPVPGVFSFVKDQYQREILEHDYKVADDNNLWNFFKNHEIEKPFIFSRELVEYGWSEEHSGASWALCMRDLEHIAKYGWESYMGLYN